MCHHAQLVTAPSANFSRCQMGYVDNWSLKCSSGLLAAGGRLEAILKQSHIAHSGQHIPPFQCLPPCWHWILAASGVVCVLRGSSCHFQRTSLHRGHWEFSVWELKFIKTNVSIFLQFLQRHKLPARRRLKFPVKNGSRPTFSAQHEDERMTGIRPRCKTALYYWQVF